MSQLIPRLSYREMPPALAEILRPRVERLGYLGEFFQCAAHQPQALISFLNLTEDLKKALSDELTEVVALSVSTLMDSAYERVQHERLCVKLGFSGAWIRQVTALRPATDDALSEEERLVQRLVLALLARKGHGTTRELEAAIGAIGPARTIAIVMLVGRYVAHALVVNSLRLEPPVPPLREGT